MTKKGLSLEQKRERILQIFLESDDVFQLKEIEKEGPKRGVTAQSIKEVVQSLVDDNLVHQVRKKSDCDISTSAHVNRVDPLWQLSDERHLPPRVGEPG